MYLTSSLRANHGSEPRRGLILMVVLALLTAFAIVGLSFVLYADAEAKAAQIARESEQGLFNQNPYDTDPQLLLSDFLGQLIFDVSDPTGLGADVNSAIRGHSLARGMYGYNDTGLNTIPFNGVGRLHNTTTPFGQGEDEANLINYQWFRDPTDPTGQKLLAGFHDPERPGFRTAPPAAGITLATPRQNWLCGFNAPYTAADANNMFLAVVDSSGNVTQPSYYRQNIFGALDSTNGNWTNAVGKYKTLRPRPTEQNGFPYPEDSTGDVKNLVGNPGGNDSQWLDLGTPVRAVPNGKAFKALYAPLIVELDSRINVSAHGNTLGQITSSSGTVFPNHVSNSGWGPWTVNIGQVMKDLTGTITDPTNPYNLEWTHLFTGTGTPLQIARYGNSLPTPGSHVPGNGTAGVFPTNAALGAAFTFPLIKSPFYSRFTFDEGVLAGTVRTATTALNPILSTPNTYFPIYPNGYTMDLTSGTSPLTNHPLAYNMFAGLPTNTDDDRIFSAGEIESLLRYNDTTSYTTTGSLLNLCPNVLAQQRARSLVTTRAFDVDAPGISPWFTSRSATGGQFGLNAYAAGTRPLPALTGALAAFPNLSQISALLPASPVNDYSGDGRMKFGLPAASTTSLMGVLSQRLDLNRPLPDYPVPGTNGIISDNVGFNAAQVARQMFAQDIFDRLRLITGADSIPTTASTASPGQDGLRWLAQLAVNIVDFIDTDDYMTPFNWNPNSPTDVVYGVELPRLLINEVFLQYTVPPPGPGKQYQVDLWVELFNPLNTTGVTPNYLTESGNARLFATDGMGTNIDGYQIALCQKDTTGIIRANTNKTGDPGLSLIINTGAPSPPGSIGSRTCQFGVKGASSATTLAPNSFFLIGPSSVPIPPTTAVVDNTEPRMTYSGDPAEIPPAPTVVLQRLACPNRPMVANSNDYVTIDYFENAAAGNSPSTLRPGAQQISTQSNVTTATRASYGRVIPFIGNIISTSNVVFQNSSGPPAAQHTLKSANINSIIPTPPINTPWLTHLDRYLSSPMELLHVAGVRPFELTQTFGESTIVPSLGQYGHRVPWFDEDLGATPTTSHCLYRLFEMVETRSRFAGMSPVQYSATFNTAAGGTMKVTLPPAFASNGLVVKPALGDVLVVVKQSDGTVMDNVRLTGNPSGSDFTFTVQQDYSGTPVPVYMLHTATGGRQAGKINLNAIQSADSEIMMALADPSTSNNFANGDIVGTGSIFENMKTTILQTPFMGNALGRFTQGDTQYPTSGSSRSLFQPAPGSTNSATLFEPPSRAGKTNHPYLRYELLNKLFNNTTSRSNVFAVWLTVGFFEVDANGKLGQEIGKSEGKTVRHRMFAIVDRTALAVPRQVATLDAPPVLPPPPNPAYPAGPATPGLINLGGTKVNSASGINVGTQLLVGTPGAANAEVVTVSAVSSTQITVTFAQGHATGEQVYIMPGNWGPQPAFDVTQSLYREIVPWYDIIE